MIELRSTLTLTGENSLTDRFRRIVSAMTVALLSSEAAVNLFSARGPPEGIRGPSRPGERGPSGLSADPIIGFRPVSAVFRSSSALLTAFDESVFRFKQGKSPKWLIYSHRSRVELRNAE